MAPVLVPMPESRTGPFDPHKSDSSELQFYVSRSIGGRNALVKTLPAQNHKNLGSGCGLRLPIVVCFSEGGFTRRKSPTQLLKKLRA
jgi:hypothetical protein